MSSPDSAHWVCSEEYYTLAAGVALTGYVLLSTVGLYTPSPCSVHWVWSDEYCILSCLGSLGMI